MIQLGEKQKLYVVKEVDFGVYLAEYDNATDKDERVLLPGKQVPEGIKKGDAIEVFVYKDSQDRMISTTATPKVTLGEIATLTVSQVGKIGAFLDWGLEKDLFLPFKEQTLKVHSGDAYPVALYIDKSKRLAATMKIYHYLKTNSPYHKDDKVTGVVYEISDNFGAFVAVDNCYSALISKKELYGNIHVGETVTARVVAVKSDGKLDLSIREKAYQQIFSDSEKVLKTIESFDGVLPFNDKANPDTIRREMQMSKNEFKRAVGHLLKEGKIEITEKSIRLK